MPDLVISHGITDTPQAISDFSLSEPESGWDSASQKFLVKASMATWPDVRDAYFSKGRPHPTLANMFIVDRRPTDLGGGDFEIDVTWKGIASDKGYRRRSQVFGETSTGERILIGASIQAEGYPAYAEKLKIDQPVLSVETEYFTTTEPVLSEVKKPISGTYTPTLPTPPTQIWSWIANPTYVYPSGWVLDSREPEQLLDKNLWRVIDRCIFRYMTEM